MQPGTRQQMALRPLALGAQDDTSNKIENKSKKINYPTLRQKRAEG
jgi:hypothetical protein